MALGNMLSGFLGGTPCTGVLVRTGVNVASGATDKMSQLINAIAVLIIVLLLLPGFSFIPMPVISSILMTSAFRLIPFKVMKQLINEDMPDFGILIFTFCVCIFMDGALGLLAGGFLALMRNAANNNTGYLSFERDGDVMVATVTGQLSYINGLDVEVSILDRIKSDSLQYLVIDVSGLKYIDLDGIDAMKNIKKLGGKTCTLSFVKLRGNAVFDASDFVNGSGVFFDSLDSAKQSVETRGPINEGGSVDDKF